MTLDEGLVMSPLVEKGDLSNYIKFIYFNLYGNAISPIKLQKSLYFLYAFWGGFVYKGIKNETETDFRGVSLHLFSPEFEAWPYGPVDRMVYVEYKDDQSFNEQRASDFAKATSPDILQFIDDLSKRIFATSDFGLVDLSHRDKSWSEVYSASVKLPMHPKSIISEYAER